LPVKLDQKGLAKLAQELGANLDKIADLEEKKKAESDSIKGDISLLEEATKLMRDKVRSKSSEEQVECEEVVDYRSNEVTITRLDTKEVVNKRTLTKEEAQLPLEALKPGGKLIAFDGGKKDRSEVKDVKPEKRVDRKIPKPGDVIDIETLHGWKTGTVVLRDNPRMLAVDVGEGKIETCPIEGEMWRWPKSAARNETTVGEPALTAPLGETAAANAEKKTRKSKPEDRVDGTPGKPDDKS
jgi:hypothetical protein